ncbi:MAG TPA: hypothetical protein PKA33_18960 [Amaricoccus sp.]|uniref:hypothetical protein n=1 Tax=Amaricoccus sp. TaxID=1872485 RepID=UPI002C621298|nr:hypothetical protein [Amaricoccus sp.]HMQ94455.1 hypothetical protein [Amaricoccus sp.]HMR54401.1 hypothetical protein [Amaricoccus sp.]HMU01423.1 hypothetical protein [Amaricoccus sp.]
MARDAGELDGDAGGDRALYGPVQAVGRLGDTPDGAVDGSILGQVDAAAGSFGSERVHGVGVAARLQRAVPRSAASAMSMLHPWSGGP